MIISDFHVHSELSTDSDAPFNKQIESAVEKGIKHLCFTEHADINFPLPKELSSDADGLLYQVDIDEYKKAFEKHSAMYSSSINLYYGIELGLKADITEKLKQYVTDNSFDFVIGSIHLVDDIDVYEPEYFEGHDEEERYRHYFDVTLENIKKFHDFDVLGHLDYISRCGTYARESYSYDKYADIIDEILKNLIQNGNGIEINTAPYKKGLERPNPCLEIIKRYKELGGEIITVGSDAHYPEYIANRFSDAEKILRAAGFSRYCIFKNRKPTFVTL